MGVQNAAASLSGSASVTAASNVLAAAVVAIAGLAATTANANVHANCHSSMTGVSSSTDTGTVQANAHSALLGVSSFTDQAHDTDQASASIAGTSTVTASGTVVVPVAAVLAGSSSTTFTATFDGQEAAASLVARGLFYVDPTKVTLIPFFRAQSVPNAFVAPQVPALRPQAPSGAQSSVSISLNRSPPKTQTGGVPNEG